MKLVNQSKNNSTLFENLEMANTPIKSAIGLMGRKKLKDNQGLFLDGYWIHTFFMKFAIDAIYLNKHLEVKEIHKNVKPWRMAKPVWRARHVVECNAGLTQQLNLEIGDKLYVGD